MYGSFLKHAALGVGQRVGEDERRLIHFPRQSLYASDFQPRYDAQKNVLIRARETAAPLVHRHAAL